MSSIHKLMVSLKKIRRPLAGGATRLWRISCIACQMTSVPLFLSVLNILLIILSTQYDVCRDPISS